MSTRVLVEPNDLIFIQSRAASNTDLVDEYAEMMQNGIEFDPAQGVQGEDGQIYVYDGLHQGSAAKQVRVKLWVEVQPDTRLDAEWLALTANQKHGLRRSREDVRRIIQLALLHPNGVNLSDREIARHCGAHHNTVSKIRQELEVSGEFRQIETRLVSRNAQTYQVDTGNIGKSRPSTPAEPGFAQELETSGEFRQMENTVKLSHTSDPTHYEPKAQEFECLCCGQEKLVGVNGSRRWCLNCSAEWPTAAAFLAAVQTRQPQALATGREAIKTRLWKLVSLVEACPDEQLEEIVTWLDDLETALTSTPESAR